MAGRTFSVWIMVAIAAAGLAIYGAAEYRGGTDANRPARSANDAVPRHEAGMMEPARSFRGATRGPVTAVAGADYRAAYDGSDDLLALTARLQGASAGGDGAATRLIGKAYEECFVVALNGLASFQRDREQRLRRASDARTREGIARAFDRVAGRCRGFDGRRLSLQQIDALRDRAVLQGDLAATAERFRIGVALADPAYGAQAQADLAGRVLASGNPEAMAAMAELMGELAASRVGDLSPLPAGNLRAEAAWQLAACELGRDCGARSAFLSTVCVHAGMGCSARTVADIYRRELLPPADFEKARQLALELKKYGAGK